MHYILTLSNGKQLTYYVRECAETFQRCMGGTVTEH
jgi:hypothetical protein